MDKHSKTVIITGGNSGLGFQCAMNLARYDKKFHIIIASRNRENSSIAVKRIIADTGNKNIHAMEIDLASLFSIRNGYYKYLESDHPPLYAIVCNAGLGANTRLTYTEDGFEKLFGVNHLGHFLLANMFLKKISTGGRIVFVSSDAHNPPSFIPFIRPRYTDAMHLAYPEKYSGCVNWKRNGMFRYATSKLCNLYCAYEMAAKIQNETNIKISVNAFNPGFMPDTNLDGKDSSSMKSVSKYLARILGRSGSLKASGVLLASLITSTQFDSLTGKYIDRGKMIKSSSLSYNTVNAKNLWIRSSELVKLGKDETIFTI